MVFMVLNMDAIFNILEKLLNVQTILALLAGTIGGLVIGSLPGLSATMGVALSIPVTFGMDPVAGLKAKSAQRHYTIT